MRLRTLYGRLSTALLIVLCLTGTTYVVVSVLATRLYQQEVAQQLNRDLARQIVAEGLPLEAGVVNREALDDLFRMLMVINPTIEIYLLDRDGQILAFSADPARVVRAAVDLGPIRRVLAGEDANRILGDDPRSLTRRKVFSVAPVPLEGSPQGYLYVVLESEEYAGITQMLQGSYIFRVSVPAIAAGTVSALVVGLLAFWLLTHRVSRLALAMERFKESGFEAPPPPRPASSPGDEIDALERAFADMAQHLVDQMGRLKEGDALRRELVANVSHDLRTPLASLQGYVETLLIKDDSLTPEQRREYLQVASRQSVHLGRLVAELFDLAGLNARETVPHREPFSLSELLQDLVQKFRLRPEAQQVRIETTSGPGIPFVSGDIALIERVLENLLDNALRYTPAGGTVRLSLETVENSVRVRVSDTGRGIPADALPKIFDRYFQADPSDRTGSDRGGLGLAIARRILELHGSVIVAESVPEQGTTFSFQLPVATPVR